MNYEEDLESAKEWLAIAKENNNNLAIQILEKLFPELKESEDERIRKALIRNFTNQHSGNFPTADGFTREQILAWLEKQGEQNTANFEEAEKEKNDFVSGQFIECRKSFNEFKEFGSYWFEYVGDDTYIGRSDNILNQRFHITPQQLFTLFTHQHCPKDNEEQGEQKVTDEVKPKFISGDYIRYKGENYKIKNIEKCGNNFIYNVSIIGEPSDPEEVKTAIGIAAEKDIVKIEQPSAYWSEEDEEMFDAVIADIQFTQKAHNHEVNQVVYEREIDWLKSLKDKVQPQHKKDWSEEDERIYNEILDFFLGDYETRCTTIDKQRHFGYWLKSLKPQSSLYDKGYNDGYSAAKYNSWKPSEEQMKWLKDVIETVPMTCRQQISLESLYNDLKKL